MYRGMFTTRPFDAGFGYLTGGDLGDYAWPPKPKEELPAEGLNNASTSSSASVAESRPRFRVRLEPAA